MRIQEDRETAEHGIEKDRSKRQMLGIHLEDSRLREIAALDLCWLRSSSTRK
jgi:hypothetical protein